MTTSPSYKSVVFSGSMSLENEWQQWADYLLKNGVPRVDLPVTGKKWQEWNNLSETDKRVEKMGYLNEQNMFIDRDDVVFVFNATADARIGNSAILEIGYAIARGKTVIAYQPHSDRGVDILFSGYCSTPEALLRQLAIT